MVLFYGQNMIPHLRFQFVRFKDRTVKFTYSQPQTNFRTTNEMYLEQLGDIKKTENKCLMKLEIPNCRYFNQVESNDLSRVYSAVLSLGSLLLVLPFSVKYDGMVNSHYTAFTSRKKVRIHTLFHGVEICWDTFKL